MKKVKLSCKIFSEKINTKVIVLGISFKLTPSNFRKINRNYQISFSPFFLTYLAYNILFSPFKEIKFITNYQEVNLVQTTIYYPDKVIHKIYQDWFILPELVNLHHFLIQELFNQLNLRFWLNYFVWLGLGLIFLLIFLLTIFGFIPFHPLIVLGLLIIIFYYLQKAVKTWLIKRRLRIIFNI